MLSLFAHAISLLNQYVTPTVRKTAFNLIVPFSDLRTTWFFLGQNAMNTTHGTRDLNRRFQSANAIP